jgi:S1-C subfamily serine protease
MRVTRVSDHTPIRARRGRVRTLVVAIVALFVLAISSGAAFAVTVPSRLASGIVVINTKLGLQASAAAGTGMVLTSSGEVLTNNHVVRGATSIKIIVPDTGKTYTGRVIGYDVGHDVAVVQAIGASNLSTVTTTSATPAIGAAVTAIGNAGGTGKLSTATGKITHVHGTVTVNDDEGGSARLTDMIGVNATVIPGDSGGPLMNSTGEVIGMDTAGSPGATFRATDATQAYAIPIVRALSIAQKVVAGTSSTSVHIGPTAFMGVQVEGGFRGNRGTGATIAGVTGSGPADRAGLTEGDVVTAVDGRHVSSSTGLTSALLAKKPGQSITITYADPFGASHSVKLTLASGPPQ